jgi:thiol-disulfide isomerase/thioredoxin
MNDPTRSRVLASAAAVLTIAAAGALLLACGMASTSKEVTSKEVTSSKEAPARKPPAKEAPASEAPGKEVDPGEGHAARARDVLLGRPAPAVVLELLDGERVRLADRFGHRPVYLEFWNTWCVPCREQMPHLEAAHRTYGDRIAVFAVNLGLNEAVETIREFRAAHALTVPIAVDGDGSLAERYHVAVTPQHVLIDRAGIVRYVGHGATPELDRALEALLREDAAPADLQPAAAQATDEPLSLTLLDGSAFTLAAHAGRPVALTFVKATCDTYLAKSRPAMAAACAAHTRQVESLRRAHPRVAWVTIAHPVWTDAATLDRYRQRLATSTPIGIDEKSAWFHRFRIRTIPTTVLLDEHGVEVARVSGPGDDLPRALAR